jgi:hypothetical protein
MPLSTISDAPRGESSAPVSPPPEQPADELRICTGCFRELPIVEFRIRYRATGVRHRTCKTCFNKYRTTKRKPRLKRRRLSKSVTALAARDNRTNVRMLALIARRMIRHFGGIDRTCEYWAREVNALMERRPGSRLSIKTFQAILYLLSLAEASERDDAKASVAKMSDGDLAGVLEWLTAQQAAGETPNGSVIDEGLR